MNTQPEALRLANELLTDRALECFDWAHDAGYELRRLHQSEKEGWRYADELEQERKRLLAVNQKLVEVLKEIDEALYVDDYGNYALLDSFDRANMCAVLNNL